MFVPYSFRLSWLQLRSKTVVLNNKDVRRFKIHSMAGPASDCARIRRYLSNAHVADFWAPTEEPRFSLKMLAALVNRNFTASRLQMSAVDGPLTDFRSMDAIFGGGVRLDALALGMREEALSVSSRRPISCACRQCRGLRRSRLTW